MRQFLNTIPLLLLVVAGCGGDAAPAAKTPDAPTDAAAVEAPVAEEPPAAEGVLTDTLSAENLPENLYINIAVRDHGTVKVKFHTKDAPKNVANVANHAIRGYYDGLTFHRIIPGFVVQGGDPRGDGTGGPGYTVEAEIKRKHLKGSMAMARTGDHVNPDRRSSGSQFYLCLEPLPQLDAGGYTVIGDLVEGLDVLEHLGQVRTGPGDRPIEPVVMEKAFVTTE